VREDEPAEHDLIVLVENDRAHGVTQVWRHGVSDAAAARAVIGTAADYQPARLSAHPVNRQSPDPARITADLAARIYEFISESLHGSRHPSIERF
jgi:hypothetical protein